MTEQRNPHALHEAAAGWRDMGKHLDGLVRDLDRQVGKAAAANWHGPAGEAFAAEWHRLKRSVDETLPAFELAAADLENAASQDKGAHAGAGSGAHDTAPDASQNDGAQSSDSQSSGTQTAYGFMALGQLATSLGGAFRGKGGGRGQRPPLTARWETSGAPQGPDPFGPPQAGPKGAGGGAGVAKGARTGEAAGDASEATPRTPDAKKPTGAQARPGTESKSNKSDKSNEDKAAETAGTPEGTQAKKGRHPKDAEAGDPKPPPPDVRRHGAFG
ncbi:WXG100 family type VII secretion target [Streptomyces monomycini]|uniref:WXG100 family type VII secretion target n=1 Tax=Streptomyces monomycini TaxID=371720 RepID=UPI0004AB658D|nr:WXG100 family type VII secretion target [Streptomyces monomycini]